MPASATTGGQFFVDVSITSLEADRRYAADFALTGGVTDDPHRRFGRHALIPIETRPVSLNVMSAFLKDAGGLSPEERAQSNRPFAEVFKELFAASVELESLKIEELRSYLARLLREKGPDVELFGAKIPQEALVYWSLPALLAIQLYFLVTLRQLVSKYAEPISTTEFSWIALYNDRLAKTVTRLSLVSAPVANLIVLVWGWPFIEWYWVKTVLSIGLLGSVWAAWLGIIELITLTKLRVGPSRSQSAASSANS